jgi:hypothetical protein
MEGDRASSDSISTTAKRTGGSNSLSVFLPVTGRIGVDRTELHYSVELWRRKAKGINRDSRCHQVYVGALDCHADV